MLGFPVIRLAVLRAKNKSPVMRKEYIHQEPQIEPREVSVRFHTQKIIRMKMVCWILTEEICVTLTGLSCDVLPRSL